MNIGIFVINKQEFKRQKMLKGLATNKQSFSYRKTCDRGSI